MNVVHLEASDPSVKAIIRASFPEYRGKKIKAIIADSVSFTGTQWDEGCKTDYAIVRLNGLNAVSIPEAPYLHESTLHNRPICLQPGVVVVCLNHFRGTESIDIVGRAENLSPMLPKPETLEDDDKTVLLATRSYKSAYAGNNQYRFTEAHNRRGITRARWDAATARLKQSGHLNASGAITTKGRNSVQNDSL